MKKINYRKRKEEKATSLEIAILQKKDEQAKQQKAERGEGREKAYNKHTASVNYSYSTNITWELVLKEKKTNTHGERSWKSKIFL